MTQEGARDNIGYYGDYIKNKNSKGNGVDSVVWDAHQEPHIRDDFDSRKEGLYENRPLWQKISILALVCPLSLGSHYSAHMLSTLQTPLTEAFGITNTQFGMVQSAVLLMGTFLPLFGGIFLDRFGLGVGSMISSLLILVGEVIVLLSCYANHFWLLIAGRCIYGVGAGVIVTAQEAILAHWFKGNGLGLATGLQIAASRAMAWTAIVTTEPIEAATGWYGNTFWVSSGLCLLSCALNIVYLVVVRYGFKDSSLLSGSGVKRAQFTMSNIMRFPPTLWLLLFIMLSMDVVWDPFSGRLVNIIKELFGSSTQLSAWKASANYAIAMVLNPVMGLFFDVVGLRPPVYLVGVVCLTVSMGLMAFSSLEPMVALVFYSLSYSINPIAAISMFPMLYDMNMIATVLGISKCVGSIGGTLMNPIIGYVYDSTHSYHTVLNVLFVVACFITALTVIFNIMTYSRFPFLNLSLRACKRRFTSEDIERAQRCNRMVSIFCICLFLTLFVASWTVYFGITFIQKMHS
eukprot:Nk52_evm21s207 gene=Nk52_evmTU21s207